jgi:hypothetical protein
LPVPSCAPYGEYDAKSVCPLPTDEMTPTTGGGTVAIAATRAAILAIRMGQSLRLGSAVKWQTRTAKHEVAWIHPVGPKTPSSRPRSVSQPPPKLRHWQHVSACAKIFTRQRPLDALEVVL